MDKRSVEVVAAAVAGFRDFLFPMNAIRAGEVKIREDVEFEAVLTLDVCRGFLSFSNDAHGFLLDRRSRLEVVGKPVGKLDGEVALRAFRVVLGAAQDAPEGIGLTPGLQDDDNGLKGWLLVDLQGFLLLDISRSSASL